MPHIQVNRERGDGNFGSLAGDFPHQLRNEITRQLRRELLDLGVVPMSSHLSAIHHYRLNGATSRACEIAVKLHRAAPNYMGLKEALYALADLTDDVRIHSLLGERKSA